MSKKITTPLTDDIVEQLHAGDDVQITGTIYVGRDSAHKRMIAALDAGEELPLAPQGQIIYYMGPSPARPGRPIGAAGPTTSYRMDPYAPRMLEQGLKGMIGKGNRGPEVREAMKKHKAVCFAAIGGAAALIADSIKEAEVIAYEDLGAEALRKLRVEDFPAIVVNDMYGGDAYEQGKAKYRLEDLSGMRIRLSAEVLRNDLVRRVEEISGQDLLACYQCGKCSAGCPVAFAMDMLPSQVIRLVQLGQVEEALESETIWFCAACQTCYARCPKGVDLSRIMEALREIALQRGGDYLDIKAIHPEELAEFPQQAFIGGFRKYTS